MKTQAEAWAAKTAGAAGTGEAVDTTPAGVAASGAILGATPQQFSASWAFVIEPIGRGGSRLIERFRVWYGESGMASHVAMPVVGFGVFVMMQRQMVGIKTRAERLAHERAEVVATVTAPASTEPAVPAPATATHPTKPTAPTANGRDRAAEGPELAAATSD